MNKIFIYILKGVLITAIFMGGLQAQIVVNWRADIFYRIGNVISYKTPDGKLPAGVHRFRAIKPSINRIPIDNPEYWELTTVGVESQPVVNPGVDIHNQIQKRIEQASAPPPSQATLDIQSRIDQQTQKIQQQSINTSQASLDIQARIEQQIKNQIAVSSAIGQPKTDVVGGKSSTSTVIQEDAVIRDWYSITTYNIGQRVRFDGLVWTALYRNHDEKPGTSGAWRPITPGRWYEKVSYAVGNIVLVSGIEYTALKPSVNANPLIEATFWATKTGDRSAIPIDKSGQTGGASQVIDGNVVITYESNTQILDLSKYPEWNPSFSYKKGVGAVYLGALWESKEDNNRGNAPSGSAKWTPRTVTSWYPAVEYIAKDVVLWKDKRYIAQWWSLNVPPDTDPDGNWVLVNDRNERLALSGQPWIKSKVYVAGDKVIWDGVDWQAKWWTKGNQPGISEEWKPVNKLPQGTNWYSGVAYYENDIVSWKNKKYIARWYRLGIQPDMDAEGVWREINSSNQIIALSGQIWSSKYNYFVNDIVSWAGKRYIAYEYRLNVQPDIDPEGLWREIDASNRMIPLSGQPWSAARVYLLNDRVTYNGRTWRAKWWTKNNIPGDGISSDSPWELQ